MKIAGTWVGHRVFDIELDKFLTLNETEINSLPNTSKFDKHSYIHGAKK